MLTIDILKEMKEADIKVLESNLTERLNELNRVKIEFELYYDLDDDKNLLSYHNILRDMDRLYSRLTVVNNYYKESDC